MIIQEDDTLIHIGTPRHSGRYPWGSGGSDHARNRDFLGMYEDLKRQGLSETEIARGMGFEKLNPDGSVRSSGTTQLRNRKIVANNAMKAERIGQAEKLAATGMSKAAIAKEMGLPNESSVRELLKPGVKDKNLILNQSREVIREAVHKYKYVDVGVGAEHFMGISRSKFDAAVSMLEEEGYIKHYLKVPQLGTKWDTTYKVLTKPGVPWLEVKKHQDDIRQIMTHSTDGGRTFNRIVEPTSIDSKRVAVKYAEDGGKESDGMIYVRPGVADTSLGKSSYAQVRIAVNGTHFIKGMAMYKDNLPKGVDLEFHTAKSRTANKLDALKKLEKDINGETDFLKSISRQHGVMNIVNEEGDWEKWSHDFSSQMLSKQSHKLATEQLALNYERKRSIYNEIQALTNPVVKRTLLAKFAEEVDSSAVDLEAASLPKTVNHVILPLSKIKENEIYAPNYKDGTRVALVRHPHAGPFEIPNLVVNNRNPAAKKAFGNAKDAVGIHHKVAEKLSGADFDGDTVLVIPNNHGKIKTEPSLEGLKDFDPKHMYPKYEGMKVLSEHGKQAEMGDISNLITDMTIKGATHAELARAIRHSMVVIDAAKHELDYKRSEQENGIKQLKKKWQEPPYYGASTLISKAGARIDVPERKQGFRIDPKTGKKIFLETGRTYPVTTVSKRTGESKTVIKTAYQKSQKLAETDNAFTLSSGTPIEKVYAEHSNRLKSLANQIRKESVTTKMLPYSPSAFKTYSVEAASLKSKLSIALRNAPVERQAQIVGNAIVKAKQDANPNMTAETLKKIKSQALKEARDRTGAKKALIEITPSEWTAIQAGAISNAMLTKILANADIDQVKQLATPKQKRLMTTTKTARAKAMIANGYTQADVAEQLGVSLTTLKTALKGD